MAERTFQGFRHPGGGGDFGGIDDDDKGVVVTDGGADGDGDMEQ